jgi:hypothetical protein
MGDCGCDLRNVPYFTNGRLPHRGPDGVCPRELMREW